MECMEIYNKWHFILLQHLYPIGIISNVDYEVLDSTKATNGHSGDIISLKSPAARLKCLQMCSKALDCVGVTIGQVDARTIHCQILRTTPQENEKVNDAEWHLI